MSKKSSKLSELCTIFADNNISAETIQKNDEFIFELKARMSTVKDYRNEAYSRHLLTDVLMITFFAMLANADEWAKIEIFAKQKEKWLRKYLELPYGVPTDDTIRLIISNIDTNHFYSLVVQLLIEVMDQMLLNAGITHEEFEPDIIAVDGKVSVGSKRNKTDKNAVRALQTLNVFSNSYRICLAQKFIDEKTNEIPAAQEVLKLIDLKGSIVMADALNCQKETIATIVKSKGDYVIAIKGNQKLFYNEVKDFFDSNEIERIKNSHGCYYKTVEKEHGGTEIREYFITGEVGWFSELNKWKKLTTFGMVKKTMKKKSGETITEYRYYICSINPDAELFARAARGHWGVENKLHWMMDFVFHDDKNTSMAKTGAKNLQIMKKIVLAILGIVKESYKMSMPKMRYQLSISYEVEVEKLLSLLSIEAVKNVLNK